MTLAEKIEKIGGDQDDTFWYYHSDRALGKKDRKWFFNGKPCWVVAVSSRGKKVCTMRVATEDGAIHDIASVNGVFPGISHEISEP